MCRSPLHHFLAALPKCEHHMHLEGSLSPELLFSLAAQNNIKLPSPAEDPAFASVEALYARYAAFTSLDDFLHYYYVGFSVLVSAKDFEALAYAYFSKAHADGVRHAEVFFDPQVHTSRGITYHTVVEGFTAARRRAEADFGLTSMLIPCLLRHLPIPDSAACFAAARDAGHFADGTLGGLGLCSTEKDRHPSLWRDVFVEAGELGIRRTAHAGEEGPADWVTAAMDELGASRIDHGVNARNSEEVMARLAAEGTMLTVCPLSNVALRGVQRLEEVPIRTFLDKGVRFSINSDDPAYFGGYILDNYCAVQEAFGLDVAEWVAVARNAVEGSWCEQERKEAIFGEIEAVEREWMEKLAV
ncbi:Adenine deaminase [Pleurostoma richardsiae]|uniref:Adenine deaminase n=1 Tax=Pleurostoma richardsiae TaxID=41990 RepID=A0AA38VGA2_9PEZI|nr:Adenine deaminase [Pleurostoma richardsiae]